MKWSHAGICLLLLGTVAYSSTLETTSLSTATYTGISSTDAVCVESSNSTQIYSNDTSTQIGCAKDSTKNKKQFPRHLLNYLAFLIGIGFIPLLIYTFSMIVGLFSIFFYFLGLFIIFPFYILGRYIWLIVRIMKDKVRAKKKQASTSSKIERNLQEPPNYFDTRLDIFKTEFKDKTSYSIEDVERTGGFFNFKGKFQKAHVRHIDEELSIGFGDGNIVDFRNTYPTVEVELDDRQKRLPFYAPMLLKNEEEVIEMNNIPLPPYE